jgi:hypothetical protein
MRKLGFLILILTIALFGREVPEFVSLTEDVSNDAEIPACSQENILTLSLTSSPQPMRGGCAAGSSRTKQNFPFSILPWSVAVTRTGATILLLLSEQRK